MKHYQRFLIGLYSFLIAISALLVALVALGWQLPLEALGSVLAEQNTSWILAAITILVFLVATKTLFDSFQRDEKVLALVKSTPLGEIQISQNAIENMIRKSLQVINGISNVNPKIKCTSDGVAVLLKVQLMPETNIPDITNEMQTTVKEYLEMHAGISLLEAKVLVEDPAPGNRTRVN